MGQVRDRNRQALAGQVAFPLGGVHVFLSYETPVQVSVGHLGPEILGEVKSSSSASDMRVAQSCSGRASVSSSVWNNCSLKGQRWTEHPRTKRLEEVRTQSLCMMGITEGALKAWSCGLGLGLRSSALAWPV